MNCKIYTNCGYIFQKLQRLMVLPNHKKIISFAISQKILNQMNSMIKIGNFSSISDVVNTSTIFFLGELSVEKTNPNFDYASIIKDKPNDNSTRTKISVALNGYVDAELENLATITQKSKSFIVRMALFRFFEIHNNADKIKKPVVIEEKLVVSKKELEEIVHEMMKKNLKEDQ
jgi:hypothetical protein